jgi:uncharacterized membrane protein YdbT with pleckstrin-like domain
MRHSMANQARDDNVPDWVTLDDGEEMLYKSHPSIIPHIFQSGVGLLLALFGILFFFGMDLFHLPGPFPRRLFGLLAILLGVVAIVAQMLRWYSTEYLVTTGEIYRKSGIVSDRFLLYPLNFTSLDVDEIVNIQTNQGHLGRFFEYGNVLISASDNAILFFEYIQDPIEFKGFARSNGGSTETEKAKSTES